MKSFHPQWFLKSRDVATVLVEESRGGSIARSRRLSRAIGVLLAFGAIARGYSPVNANSPSRQRLGLSLAEAPAMKGIRDWLLIALGNRAVLSNERIDDHERLNSARRRGGII